MQAFLSVLSIPFILLNAFGGIASGIWLGILGQWSAIGQGLLAVLLSTFILGFAMMPGLIFAAPAALLAQKGKLILAFPFMLLGLLYTYAVIVIWCMSVFYFFMQQSNAASFWPLLIWSYGIALGSLMSIAQREQQSGNGEGSTMTTFFAQIAYVIMALVAIFARVSLLDLVITFSGVMLVGMLIQTVIAVAIMIEQRRLGEI